MFPAQQVSLCCLIFRHDFHFLEDYAAPRTLQSILAYRDRSVTMGNAEQGAVRDLPRAERLFSSRYGDASFIVICSGVSHFYYVHPVQFLLFTQKLHAAIARVPEARLREARFSVLERVLDNRRMTRHYEFCCNSTELDGELPRVVYRGETGDLMDGCASDPVAFASAVMQALQLDEASGDELYLFGGVDQDHQSCFWRVVIHNSARPCNYSARMRDQEVAFMTSPAAANICPSVHVVEWLQPLSRGKSPVYHIVPGTMHPGSAWSFYDVTHSHFVKFKGVFTVGERSLAVAQEEGHVPEHLASCVNLSWETIAEEAASDAAVDYARHQLPADLDPKRTFPFNTQSLAGVSIDVYLYRMFTAFVARSRDTPYSAAAPVTPNLLQSFIDHASVECRERLAFVMRRKGTTGEEVTVYYSAPAPTRLVDNGKQYSHWRLVFQSKERLAKSNVLKVKVRYPSDEEGRKDQVVMVNLLEELYTSMRIYTSIYPALFRGEHDPNCFYTWAGYPHLFSELVAAVDRAPFFKATGEVHLRLGAAAGPHVDWALQSEVILQASGLGRELTYSNMVRAIVTLFYHLVEGPTLESLYQRVHAVEPERTRDEVRGDMFYLMLSQVAAHIQRPDLKWNWFTFLHSAKEGTGKSTISTFYKCALGDLFKKFSDLTPVTGNFNEALKGLSVAALEEANQPGVMGKQNRQAADQLKSLVTDTEIAFTAKGGETEHHTSLVNFYMCMNHVPFSLGRRWWSVESTAKHLSDSVYAFIHRHAKTIEGARMISYFFLTFPLPENIEKVATGHAPATADTKMEAIRELPAIIRYLYDAVYRNNGTRSEAGVLRAGAQSDEVVPTLGDWEGPLKRPSDAQNPNPYPPGCRNYWDWVQYHDTGDSDAPGQESDENSRFLPLIDLGKALSRSANYDNRSINASRLAESAEELRNFVEAGGGGEVFLPDEFKEGSMLRMGYNVPGLPNSGRPMGEPLLTTTSRRLGPDTKFTPSSGHLVMLPSWSFIKNTFETSPQYSHLRVTPMPIAHGLGPQTVFSQAIKRAQVAFGYETCCFNTVECDHPYSAVDEFILPAQ